MNNALQVSGKSSGVRRKRQLACKNADIHSDSNAIRLHESFKNKIAKLLSDLSVTHELKYRFALKFKKEDVDPLDKEKCNMIMGYARSAFPIWWFIEPTMNSSKLLNHYLQLTLLFDPMTVTEDFYKGVFLVHCEDAVDRAWSDFKKDQFAYLYDLFKCGGDYNYLSMYKIK